MLVDLRPVNLTGKEFQKRLDEVQITVNKNAIPNDPEKPFVTSGIRIGTPAATTRGFDEDDFRQIAKLIYMTATEYPEKADEIRAAVTALRQAPALPIKLLKRSDAMYAPLADRLRPKTLDEVVGQQHILGEGKLLRRIAESGNLPNIIFFGPSGTGKTTTANILAAAAGKRLHRLNATTASLSDIKNIAEEIDTIIAPNGVLLYLDEIQYFNKKQQQSLLDFVEKGTITLIASTTENPYFLCIRRASVALYGV